MNVSAVDPLHVAEQRVPPHSLLRQACMRLLWHAGGRARRSVGHRTDHPLRSKSNGSPVRLPPSRLHAGDPLLLLVRWVDRDATGGAPIALLLQWVERNEPS